MTDAPARSEVPIACSLAGADQSARLRDWHRLIADGSVRRVPDGYAVDLPRSSADDAFRLVLAEQHCCPFTTFGLHLTAESLALTATAPASASVLLDDLFQPRREHRAC